MPFQISPGSNEEIAALIETLHRTGQRLEELTGGEVDTVADRDGRTFLLRHAQEHLRHSEAAKQAAILNALPAHIALLDTQGVIISVNEAWRRFGSENGLRSPDVGIGRNYLDICACAHGDDASEAPKVEEGIRSVLAGEAPSFSIEYPCHSPAEPRWFLMTVTPLADDRRNGAVVMHLNITERRRGEEEMRRFSTAMDAVSDAIFLIDRSTMRFVHINDAACHFQGQTRAEMLALEPWVLFGTSRAELERTYDTLIASGVDAEPLEMPRRRGDGSQAWIELRRHAQRTDERWTIVSLVRDITESKRLELEKEQYLKFFMLSTNPMCIADPFGRFERVNPAFEQMVGYSASELTSKPFLDFVLAEDRQATVDEMKRQVETRPSMHFENRYVRKDGAIVHLSWMAYFDKRDGVTYAAANDITESRRADARIVYLNRVYAMLSGINTLIMRAGSRDELFKEACRIAVEKGGFRMSLITMLDQSTAKIVPVASAGMGEALLTATKEVLSSGPDAQNTIVARTIREKTPCVFNNLQSDSGVIFGKQYAEAGIRSMAVLPLLVAGVAEGGFALYAGESEFFQEEEMTLLGELAGDIAFAIDHIEKQERLDYLAYYDALTGLANRTLFLERVAQHMRSAAVGGHKLALFLIDLERFKNINDSLGRPAGDALLRQVAEWLAPNIGGASLLARLDADHFAAVMPEVSQDRDVARPLEKIMDAFVDHPFRLNEAVFRVAARVGGAVFPDDGADADTLFRHAEAALKKAKASGQRYLFYNQTMTEAVAAKLSLENQLRQAIDNEEFVLHYQPKVNLVSGRMSSAEALIRWNDPRTGLVPPGRFIPILEETGMIYDVGRWALKKAIEDYLRWRAAGLPAVRIAVNVSALQLRHRGFIEEIRQAIGIDSNAAAGLELEITESLIMEDVKGTIASLQAIRDLGVSVAIDDFGTGFSSLSYLAKLPLDTLKIDRSFVIDMTAGPEGLALLSTIISLAHALKLTVVAEGVETEEQARLLRLLSCDEMQGFLFSKPVPSELFETRFLVPPAIG